MTIVPTLCVTMCGIGGILRRDGRPIPDEWLDAIDARIAHRGPDGGGRFCDQVAFEHRGEQRTVEVALVHRRLSIIDHEGGAQPMISESGKHAGEDVVSVVFNGCIYNHRELRADLERAGRTFESDHSDTEVIIHGYREWGRVVTDRLEGMYAFALWDRRKQSLVLARDWFGEKPLYVRLGTGELDGVLLFASDARALADIERIANGTPIDESINHTWMPRYLQLGYNAGGTSIYGRGESVVRNLPPTIVARIDELMPRQIRESHSQADFERLIEQAVARRLEADVPLGCFLSGGVDSSLIAHFAKKHKPGLRTFSVRMPDERYDESHHAEEVASHLETDHTTLDVEIRPAEDLVHLIAMLGQPFGDSSILPTYWVSKAAREHVKVALSGDGGDELFLGYDRHIAARHLHRHRRLLQWIPRRWLKGTHPKSRRHRIARLGAMARDLRTLGIASMLSIFTQHQIYDLLSGREWESITQPPGADPMQSLRRFDLTSYLPDDLLCKVDTASMAVALEVRAPFLDRDLVRAALAAPTWQLVPYGKRKGLLREIARKHLPESAVDRPKMGFAIPIGEWFRNDFGGMRALLLEHLQRERSFGPIEINHDAVRMLIDEHLDGAADHGQRLFVLLTLAIWASLNEGSSS